MNLNEFRMDFQLAVRVLCWDNFSKDILFQTGTPCQASFNFLYHGVQDLSRAAAE